MITIYNPTYLHTYMENTKIIELKEEYEEIIKTLEKQYYALVPQSYHRKYVGGHHDALKRVVKDLERLLK